MKNKPDILRSYRRDILEEVKRLGIPESSSTSLGEVNGHPILCHRIGSGDKRVFISGGVHGNEPGGALATLSCMSRFLLMDYLLKPEHADKRKQCQYFVDSNALEFQLHVCPCVNPWGYECNTRENANGVDINRDFEKFEAEESRLVADYLYGHEFIFAMDMHEGSPNEIWKDFDPAKNPDGTWLYELCHDHSIRMGRQMIDAVREKGLDVCDGDTIYDDVNSNGVVWYPEGRKSTDYAAGNSLDAYLWKNHSPQVFTSETCMTASIEDWIEAQGTMLNTAMKCVLDRS